MANDYLAHHGVLGQKWGVRRYQNPDGTLTKAGRKHYGNISGEKMYKELKKQVRNKRQEYNNYDWSKKFAVNSAIGKNSRKLIEEDKRLRKEFENSKEYKEWEKKVDKFEREYEDSTDIEAYDKGWEKLMSERPKENWNTLRFAVIYGAEGRKYANDYLFKGGKDLTLAYLKDLGYDDQTSQDFVQKLIRSNRTLGTI